MEKTKTEISENKKSGKKREQSRERNEMRRQSENGLDYRHMKEERERERERESQNFVSTIILVLCDNVGVKQGFLFEIV